MSALMSAALVAELILLLLVLLGISWLRSRAAARRDAKAMRVLISRIKQGKDGREQAIREYLSQQIGLSGNALEQTGTAMLRAELALLQRFAGIYRQRDAGAAAQFDIDLAAALMPYQSLSVDGALLGAETAEESADAADAATLEALRTQNSRLEDELRITMETMSRMLTEYSTMFGGELPSEGKAPGATMAASQQSMDPLTDDGLAGAGWPEIDPDSEQDLFAAGDKDAPDVASGQDAVAYETQEGTAADSPPADPSDDVELKGAASSQDSSAATSGLEAVADVLAEQVDERERAVPEAPTVDVAGSAAVGVTMDPAAVAAYDESRDFDIEVTADDDLFDAVDHVAEAGVGPVSHRE